MFMKIKTHETDSLHWCIVVGSHFSKQNYKVLYGIKKMTYSALAVFSHMIAEFSRGSQTIVRTASKRRSDGAEEKPNVFKGRNLERIRGL